MATITAPLATMLLGLFIIIAGSICLIIGDAMENVYIVMKYISLGMFILGGAEIIGCTIWLIVVLRKHLKTKK